MWALYRRLRVWCDRGQGGATSGGRVFFGGVAALPYGSSLPLRPVGIGPCRMAGQRRIWPVTKGRWQEVRDGVVDNQDRCGLAWGWGCGESETARKAWVLEIVEVCERWGNGRLGCVVSGIAGVRR